MPKHLPIILFSCSHAGSHSTGNLQGTINKVKRYANLLPNLRLTKTKEHSGKAQKHYFQYNYFLASGLGSNILLYQADGETLKLLEQSPTLQPNIGQLSNARYFLAAKK